MTRIILALLIAACALTAVAKEKPVPNSWAADGKGNAYLLYRGMDIEPLDQSAATSCVGCAAAKALEIMHGREFSAEWIFAASRKAGDPRGLGSYCEWAAEAATDIGVLPAAAYAALGDDLRVYSAKRAMKWIRGPPEKLLPIAALYKSPGYIHVDTWSELRGAISNGYPVIVGSGVGFGPNRGQVRNSDGELRARWWSRWSHAMVFIGISDAGRNKGALVLNSWGKYWVQGPKRFGDEPEGSFWVAKHTVERMLSSYDDAYVILPIEGL